MSSSTCFPAPEAHIYSHRDTELHQPHSNDQYLTDSGSPADADVAPYARTDRHNHAGYSNHVSSALASSGQFETTQVEGALRYTHMGDEAVNSYASPQLVSPQPTLPSFQYSSQLSWYEWPSEAPANVYQAYSEHSTSQPEIYTGNVSYPPQAPEVPHSFENQQFMHQYYPAVQELGEPGPTPPTSNYYGDAGYIQQPFPASTPFLERGPAQSTYSTNTQPRYYYAAHQPVLPEQRSSYSELAINLKFMSSLTQSPPVRQGTPKPSRDFSVPKRKSDAISRTKTPSVDTKTNPFALGLDGPPLTAIGRKFPLSMPLPVFLPPPLNATGPSNSSICAASVSVHTNTTVPTSVPTPSPTPPPKASKTGKTRSSRSINEPRRPSLACTFCRERKIACGRPPDESPDPTCNQCARRSFRCRYLDLKSTSRASSSRGQSSSLKRQ